MLRLFIVLIVIVSAFCFYSVYSALKPMQVSPTLIEIKKTDTANSIAQNLFDSKIIRSSFAFKVYTRIKGADKKLFSGQYLFKGNLGLDDVVKILQSGKVAFKQLTIPEGLSLDKTLKLISQKGFGNLNILQKIASDSLFANELCGYNNLEGFLYPETYNIPLGADEKFILKQMVEHFFKKISNIEFSDSLLTEYEYITLASIVEKEALFDREKPIIASVYLNRIKKNMLLQADPTISYIKEQKNIKRRRVLYKDLEIDSPYNTYKYAGIPPTPICSPAISSIKAVAKPHLGDYYFFFASPNGTHVFSQNYKQHLQRQKQMRAAYGNR